MNVLTQKNARSTPGGRSGRKAALFYLLPLLLVLLLQITGAVSIPELRLEDGFYQSPTVIPSDISVIGIDEETLARYGKFEEWGRDKIAELITLLSADGKNAPAVIAVDIGFYGETDPETDAALVKAVKDAGNVVLVSTVTFGDILREYEDGSFTVSTGAVLHETPFEALDEAAAAVGHSNVDLDADGVARHAWGMIPYTDRDGETRQIPSFAAQIVALAEGKAPDKDVGRFYITYSGEPRDYCGTVGAEYSLYRVLEGKCNPAVFRDGIVLIGAYASGTQDNYHTSIDRREQMYGVEIHANVVNQLREGITKTELTAPVHVLITVGLCVLCVLLLLFLDTKISVPASLLLAALYVLLARFLYTGPGILLPLLTPSLTAALLCVTHIAVRYFTVHREKKRIIESYGKYLSPEVAATIADTGEENLKLGGTKKDVAVLFVDIRGFTSLSERLEPEQVVEMLNSYLSITTTAIFRNKGTVDKFIGDATMGVFNAPLDLDDYTFRAVCAGLDMADAAKSIDDKLTEDLRGRVGFGVGINCGDAVVGNIGTDFRMEYTAIGDTVNTASRLEGQAKAGQVIISRAVYERVCDRIECEALGSVALKGKAEPVEIWRALRVKCQAPAKPSSPEIEGKADGL